MVSVLLTGVTSGIGAILLEQCYQNGFTTSVVVRTTSQKTELQKKYLSLDIFVADLSKRADITKLISQIKSKIFDYVVLNAGTGDVGKFHELGDDSITKTIETNLITNMRIMRALIPQALPNKTKFVITSSIVAHFPGRQYVSYAASKAALTHFYNGIAVEYPKLPLLCVEIGGVKTPFHKKAGANYDHHKLKSATKIGKRLFSAMLHKTGVKTLAFDWYILRKAALLFYDLKVPIMKQMKKK